MTQFNFFPSDERIAQLFGLSPQWEALQPYSDYLGYPMWCALAALFFLLEMLFPRCRTSWILASALITGVIVKLGQVYGWGVFSLGEQIAMFALFTIAALWLWLARFKAPGEASPAE
jgi:membrane protein implicated in regulation of membrane protease activity